MRMLDLSSNSRFVRLNIDAGLEDLAQCLMFLFWPDGLIKFRHLQKQQKVAILCGLWASASTPSVFCAPTLPGWAAVAPNQFHFALMSQTVDWNNWKSENVKCGHVPAQEHHISWNSLRAAVLYRCLHNFIYPNTYNKDLNITVFPKWFLMNKIQ